MKIKKRWPLNAEVLETERVLRAEGVHTVCEEAGCPNRGECFSKKRLTFLILGYLCTRSCKFCGVVKGNPGPVDPGEPEKISQAIERLGLKEVVITSVTRDDLSDGGASFFREVIERIKALDREAKIEVLTPDFKGDYSCLEAVLNGGPDIFSHNVETVPRLYPEIRPEANYRRSLEVLKFSSSFPESKIKSGLMLGLGEEVNEVEEVLADMKDSGCEIVTIGQYLRPSLRQIAVKEYIPEGIFRYYEDIGKALGFQEVYAGTFVRSSYKI